MGVIVGTVMKIDQTRGVIRVGRMELRASTQVSLAELTPGTSVTVTCEERDGEFWADCDQIERVLMP